MSGLPSSVLSPELTDLSTVRRPKTGVQIAQVIITSTTTITITITSKTTITSNTTLTTLSTTASFSWVASFSARIEGPFRRRDRVLRSTTEAAEGGLVGQN